MQTEIPFTLQIIVNKYSKALYMKKLLKLSVLSILLITASSCFGQKIVHKTSDAKKLEVNKAQFIGKPLKVLLAEIEPKIKFVYGNPENRWAGAVGGTYLKFHFIDRTEYGKVLKKKAKPLGIVVNFQLDPKNTHKPLPKEGLKEWTEVNTNEYGDMIITDIRVIGND